MSESKSMANKKSSKPKAGDQIQVKEGIAMPEFPDLMIAGWTGIVLETQGRGATMKVILEWDDTTLNKMPDDYKAHCETQQMFHAMACLPIDTVDLANEESA